MRVLVAVCSKTFNTLKVANSIKEAMGADLTQIEDRKPHGFVLNGTLAMLRWKSPIKTCRTDLKNYDLLILCCPTWSLSPPAAVNRYVQELQNTEGKKLAVVVTMGGSGGDRVAGKLRKALEKKGIRYLDSLVLRTEDVRRGAYFQKSSEFVARLRSKASLPYVVEETKEKVGRLFRLVNVLLKIVR